ncbi:MAG TPA: class I SAM-dependent methyltransferase [Acidothermaceae bacterium]|nr:class I SAM-dependent methyltransferase [Acidothermaceae bacterium]
MDAEYWNQRYDQPELVWSAGPNVWVEQVASGLAPGTALDLGAGEGRNALWLAENGWHATAVDFSRVAIERARVLALKRLDDTASRFRGLCADLLSYEPPPESSDLVMLIYLQMPTEQRRKVIETAASAVRAGGQLLVVAHDSDNLVHGYGGPQDPSVLYTADDITADLATSGLFIDRAEQVVRVVTTDTGPRQALDALVVAFRPAHN